MTSEKISRAETEIATVLQRLEQETGEIVDAVCVYDVDVSSCGDARRKMLRTVYISTHRVPGNCWGQSFPEKEAEREFVTRK
jgi:hypothetical protein